MSASLVGAWKAEESAPFAGWDFSHLAGRVIEESPPWSYEELVRAHLLGARSLLDLGTGGGEVLSRLADAFPRRVVATEAWAPNVVIARERLAPLGVEVVAYEATDAGAMLDFADASFDVVISRHEAYRASEVARVLTSGGSFVTQQVTGDSLAELRDLFASAAAWPHVTVDHLSEELRAAGLAVEDAGEWHGWMTFKDVGALVYYLKNVPWQVPGFSVARDERVLADLQRRLERDGALRFGIGRLLITARKT